MRGKVSFNMAITILVSAVIAAVISFPLASLLEKPVYDLKMKQLDLSPGTIGSEAGEGIPVARSIDDMGKMETFTLEVSALNSTIPLDGTYYYRVWLDSGEKVAVLVNLDAVQEFEDESKVRLPIGRWVKWEHTAKEKSDYENYYEGSFTDFSYYVDMAGDFGRVPSQRAISSQLFSLFMLIFEFLIACLIRHEGVKRGWFEPELFKKKYEQKAKETQTRDEMEQWAVSAYAIWAGYIGEWNLIGGWVKTPANQKKMRKILARDWGIHNAGQARSMILQLTDPKGYNGTDQVSLAWDWCRAMQLIGCFFLCGYIDRQEMRELSCEVGRKIQRKFSSWEDLCVNYLDGYARWRRSLGGQPEGYIEERMRIYHALKEKPDGPYSLPFQTFLSPQVYEEQKEIGTF